MIYASATASLAALEVLVHVDRALIPSDLRLLEIDIPPAVAIENCDPSSLAPDWRRLPAPTELQDFGSSWIAERRTPVLRVPSAVLDSECSYLVNPVHPDVAGISVVGNREFVFDSRLFGQVPRHSAPRSSRRGRTAKRDRTK